MQILRKNKTPRYYLLKGVQNLWIKSYIVIINGKSLYDQAIDADVKRSKEIRKLKTGQSEDHTTECLVDYEYFKNVYKLIAIDLSRQKQLDANPKEFGK